MVIGILGLGRLGGTLAVLLDEAGHTVRPWRRGQPFPECDLAWITVRDEAIGEVARSLPAGPVVLHASGATGLEGVAHHAEHGSLHLLQSFPGVDVAVPPLSGVPAAVAGTERAREVARTVATSLGMEPFDVPGDRRLYHAAAVMAGNYATTLLGLASELLRDAGVDADRAPALLAPLALASLRQAAERGPAQALTGPHARGDEDVIRAHIAAIWASNPDIAPVYEALSAATFDLARRRSEKGE
ncbi:MAG: DUF2520 domain-containing protein [Proteobacteria bacterium]|nr:DUF2520 domain-containing protein [Pseudomonadota bacterium]MCP4919168.1 DUF2520 domain-containing protein [Pseudomonadota bacterium]